LNGVAADVSSLQAGKRMLFSAGGKPSRPLLSAANGNRRMQKPRFLSLSQPETRGQSAWFSCHHGRAGVEKTVHEGCHLMSIALFQGFHPCIVNTAA